MLEWRKSLIEQVLTAYPQQDTAKTASAITEFNPDNGWIKSD